MLCGRKNDLIRVTKNRQAFYEKAKTVPSAAKVMDTVFWDAKGLILAKFLELGQTITAARYVQTLHKLRRSLRDKRPGRNIIILHDNARPPRRLPHIGSNCKDGVGSSSTPLL